MEDKLDDIDDTPLLVAMLAKRNQEVDLHGDTAIPNRATR